MARIGRVLLSAALLISAALTSDAAAAVELEQLSQTQLATELPHWQSLGIVPGDVIMRNDQVSVVISTVACEKIPSRLGRCLVLNPELGPQLLPTVVPGPQTHWQKIEIGKNERVAILRLSHQDEQWSVELSYRIRAQTSWIQITTIIRNRQSERTLELPVADALIGGPQVRQQQSSVATWLGDRAAAALVPVGAAVSVEPFEGQGAAVVFASGDPSVSLFKRVGRRVFGSSGGSYLPDLLLPGVDDAAEDRGDWFRIAPGTERTIVRRLVLTSDPARIEHLVGLANQRSATTLTGNSQSGFPTVATEDTPIWPRKIVGHLRGSSAGPTTTLETGENPKPTALAEQATVPEPALLPTTLLDITNLPPPTE